jgi:ribosomal-protein-alanine N-acetyltransferase
MQLITQRLTLAPITTALLDGDEQPTGWPEPDTAPLLRDICESGEGTPWVPWVARDAKGDIVGDAGFKGPPDDEGAVEMGWFSCRVYRRRGFAAEAVTAMAGWALESGALLVRAEIHRDNAASIGVARRAGFVLTGIGDDGLYLWFERR